MFLLVDPPSGNLTDLFFLRFFVSEKFVSFISSSFHSYPCWVQEGPKNVGNPQQDGYEVKWECQGETCIIYTSKRLFKWIWNLTGCFSPLPSSYHRLWARTFPGEEVPEISGRRRLALLLRRLPHPDAVLGRAAQTRAQREAQRGAQTRASTVLGIRVLSVEPGGGGRGQGRGREGGLG